MFDQVSYAPAILPAGLKRIAVATCAVAASLAAAGAQTIAGPASGVMEQMAADYVRFREDVAFVDKAGFTSAQDIREAHRRLAGHNPQALADGWLVYAAFVAADTPEFADGLQQVAGNRRKRDAFVAELNADPLLPGTVPGAEAAVRRVLVSAAKDAEEFKRVGSVFQQQAYAMQKTSWGVEKYATSGADRIADALAYRTARGSAAAPGLSPVEKRGVVSPSLASVSASWKADWSGADVGQPALAERAGGTLDRVMYLATLFALDRKDPQLVSAFASNTTGARCIARKQDLLGACISATRMPYEEAFCIGTHALADMGECVGAVADTGGQFASN